MGRLFMYVSSWSHGKSQAGIGLFEVDAETGALEYRGKQIEGADFNVSWFDRKNRLLYALSTTAKLPGLRAGGGGQIFVFAADGETGRLRLLKSTPTWSISPAYMAIDLSGRYMVVANHASRSTVTKVRKDAFGKYRLLVEYDDSTVELFEVREDGTVGELLDVVYHHGDGPEWRQTNAHPHSCNMSPSGRLFAVCDKGNDTVSMYTINREKQRLELASGIFRHAPGTLPRYCAYHPSLPYFYHNNEACMDLHAFRYDEEGRLEPIGAFSSLPDGFSGDSRCRGEVLEQQDLLMHPNGRFLYDVVRGPNTIAVFAVDQSTGRLERIQDLFVGGQWPRGIAMSPDGRFMALCSVGSGGICMYSVGEDGRLSPTGHTGELEYAAYASFWAPES